MQSTHASDNSRHWRTKFSRFIDLYIENPYLINEKKLPHARILI